MPMITLQGAVRVLAAAWSGAWMAAALLAGPPAAPQEKQMKAVKIREGVYMAPAAGNVFMITTPEGNVVVDTALEEMAADAKRVLVRENQAPVKYIILTHGHADHIGGVALWKEPETQIIAQRNYVEFVNYVTRLEGFFTPRNAVAFRPPPNEVGPWGGNF